MSKAPLIYYVEDDEHIRDLTAYALHQAGMEVRAFHDGDGLVERCALEPPDAVLLDIMLPGDDGLVLLQALRGNAATENLPVMMLTAKGTEFDKVVGLDAGADDYLAKPFGMMELISRVNALRGARAVRAKAPQKRWRNPVTLWPSARSSCRRPPAPWWRMAGKSTSHARSSTFCARSWRTRAACSPASSCSSRCGA